MKHKLTVPITVKQTCRLQITITTNLKQTILQTIIWYLALRSKCNFENSWIFFSFKLLFFLVFGSFWLLKLKIIFLKKNWCFYKQKTLKINLYHTPKQAMYKSKQADAHHIFETYLKIEGKNMLKKIMLCQLKMVPI